jgi:translation elongation factor EF-Ts
MKQTKNQIKKILSSSILKNNLDKKENKSPLIEVVAENLFEARNSDYIDFLESIIKSDTKRFTSSLNSIKNNPSVYSVNDDSKEKMVVDISKTLVERIKSRNNLELLEVAVKANFFDKERKDIYTPKSIDIIKKYGSSSVMDLVKDIKTSKKKKNNARL